MKLAENNKPSKKKPMILVTIETDSITLDFHRRFAFPKNASHLLKIALWWIK